MNVLELRESFYWGFWFDLRIGSGLTLVYFSISSLFCALTTARQTNFFLTLILSPILGVLSCFYFLQTSMAPSILGLESLSSLKFNSYLFPLLFTFLFSSALFFFVMNSNYLKIRSIRSGSTSGNLLFLIIMISFIYSPNTRTFTSLDWSKTRSSSEHVYNLISTNPIHQLLDSFLFYGTLLPKFEISRSPSDADFPLVQLGQPNKYPIEKQKLPPHTSLVVIVDSALEQLASEFFENSYRTKRFLLPQKKWEKNLFSLINSFPDLSKKSSILNPELYRKSLLLKSIDNYSKFFFLNKLSKARGYFKTQGFKEIKTENKNYSHALARMKALTEIQSPLFAFLDLNFSQKSYSALAPIPKENPHRKFLEIIGNSPMFKQTFFVFLNTLESDSRFSRATLFHQNLNLKSKGNDLASIFDLFPSFFNLTETPYVNRGLGQNLFQDRAGYLTVTFSRSADRDVVKVYGRKWLSMGQPRKIRGLYLYSKKGMESYNEAHENPEEEAYRNKLGTTSYLKSLSLNKELFD